MRIKVLISGLLAAALLLGAASIELVDWAMGVVAVILQLIFSYAWPRLLRSESPWMTSSILALCALSSSAVTIFVPGVSQMSHGVEVIAVGVLLVFISQVLRGADAEGRMAGAVSGITGVAIAVLGSGWAALGTTTFGFAVTLLSVLSLLGAGAFAITRLPNRITLPLGTLVGGALGAAATALPLGLHWYVGLALGLVVGVLVSSMRALALATRSVQNLTGVLGLASGIVLMIGAAGWYSMELMRFS